MSEEQKPRPKTWEELWPGRFLQAIDLKGQLVTVKIEDVFLSEDEGVTRPGRIKFRGEKKLLPLNKTNGLCLKAMFGKQPADWIGKTIVLSCNETDRNPATKEIEPVVRIWGSPDIREDLTVTITRPRRKDTRMTMHAGRPPGEATPRTAATPAVDVAAILAQLNAPALTQPELEQLRAAATAAKGQLGRDAQLAIKAAIESAQERIGKAAKAAETGI